MDGLDVIARYDVLDDHAYPCAGDGLSRIEVPLFGIFPKPLGVLAHDMVGRQDRRVGLVKVDAVGVEPYMHLHVPCVCLLNGPCQRIPGLLLTPTALRTGEPVSNRFVFAAVECVSCRADLEDDGIDAEGLQRIQQKNHLLLLPFGVTDRFGRRPIDVRYRSNPSTAKAYLRFQCTK